MPIWNSIPRQLAVLVAPILDGRTRVVYGSRFLAGRPAAPWITIAANRFLTAVTNVLYGARITDMETCYKVMRAEMARGLDLESNRFDIEPEITAKLLRIGPPHSRIARAFEPRSRAQGKKIGWRDGIRAIQVLFVTASATMIPGQWRGGRVRRSWPDRWVSREGRGRPADPIPRATR